MAGKNKTDKQIELDTYTHSGDKRKNNPPVGLVSNATDKLNGRTKYQHDPHIDPALSWAGKTEGMNIEVQNVSLHIHERIDPARIIKSFLKPQKKDEQMSLFEEPENDPPLTKAIDFYHHDQSWTNRLIAGDSLLVMNSLLVKEGMAGKVQMVYFDPPYGITYNSNFQPFVNKRDVKDGNDAEIPAEPEMIQAFRDTWELGIHSYLSYLRNRLLLAKELLNNSGSVFVQIGLENQHYVRAIMDEIFGPKNFVSIIAFQKTGFKRTKSIQNVSDFLIWYSKDISSPMKFKKLYLPKTLGDIDNPSNRYDQVELHTGERRALTKEEKRNPSLIPSNSRVYQLIDVTSQGSNKDTESYFYNGVEHFCPSNRSWDVVKLKRIENSGRLISTGKRLMYIKYLDEFPVFEITNIWDDCAITPDMVYVVQTNPTIIQRCILMSSDPGDIILDITCGSGTSALVAEQWGRRWITCDTSRVAIALTKQRLMTTHFDYYDFAYPTQGLKSGFKYKSVPHLSLTDIANGEKCKSETLYDQPEKKPNILRVTGPFTVEAVPSLRVKPFDGNTPKLEVSGTELARTGETGKQADWRDELKATGIRAVGGRIIQFSRVEPMTATRFLHARAEVLEKDGTNKLAYISFGPDYGPLEQRQAEAAMQEVMKLHEKPDFVIFSAFHFDPEAAKDIDQMELKGVTILKAQMSVDLLTADLRKKRSSNQSYWLIGQPDIEVKKQKDGRYIVKLHGFDFYNPATGEIESKGTKHIAMWFLDTDYDERSIMPDQVFFPESDVKRDWSKLAKALKAEVNEEALEKFSGVESIPFSAGDNKKIAVKIIDNRGIESFVIKGLE